MWLQKTKPSNASRKWKLSGKALSDVSSSTRTLELCSKTTLSLYLQHRIVSNCCYQMAQQKKDRASLLYLIACDFLRL